MGRRRSFDWDKAVELYKSGMSLKEVGDQLGVDHSAIYNALKKLGVARRDNRKYKVNHSAFDELTPESAYWIGFLMADGCITGNKDGEAHLSVNLSPKDEPHLKKFLDFLESDYPITYFRPGGFSNGEIEYPRVRIVSQRLADALATYGVLPRKTGSEEVLDGRLLHNIDFWRGVIDGDGCITIKKSGRFQLKLVGSEQLLTQWLHFVTAIHLTKTSVRPRKSADAFDVELSEGPTRTILKTLYGHGPVVYLDRKAEKAMTILMRDLDYD